MELLRIGQRFPELEARAVDGSTMRLPDAVLGRIAVIIFYRGHW